MVAEDPAQPGRGERVTAVRAFRHDEQRLGDGLGSLGEQVGLDHARDVRVDRHAAFLVALAGYPHPPPADVGVSDSQPEHLRRPQPGQQHQPGDRPVPVGAETAQQRGGLGPVKSPRQPPRPPDPQVRPRPGPGQVRQQAGPLPPGRAPCGRAPRHRVRRARVAHRPEPEQPGDRRHPAVDDGRREPRRAAAGQRDHVLVLALAPLGPVRGQVPQQRVRGHGVQAGPRRASGRSAAGRTRRRGPAGE